MQNVNADRATLIALARRDYDTFATLLIHERLEYGITEYQRRVFWRMVSMDIERYACALPRGHIKTTLLKLAIVYLLTYSDKIVFPLFLSGTHDLASEGVGDIVSILKSETYTQIFGEVTFTRSRSERGDYHFELTKHLLRDDNSIYVKQAECVLRGRSSGQALRGTSVKMRRPDFIGMDDIDQDDDINAENGYQKLKNWVYGPVLKVGYRTTKFVHIGNYIARQCVIGDHVTDPAWVSDHFSALIPEGTPLWPEYWTKEQLLADFKLYERQGMANVWFAEMLNNPLENASGMIGFSDIRFLPELQPGANGVQYRSAFIVVDPAISDTKKANATAIAVHAYNIERDIWQLAEIHSEVGLDPLTTYAKMMEMSVKWGVTIWFIEAVAYQASLLPLYRAFLENVGSNIRLLPTPGSKKRKSARIIPWINLVKAKEYALSLGQLEIVRDMIAYKPQNKENKDDALDVGAYFIPCHTEHGVLIESANTTIMRNSDDRQTLDGSIFVRR